MWFDEKAADRATEFFRDYLQHTKGEWSGKPFNLEPWQEREIIRPLFGWKRDDGTRRFRTGYISVARKNGKSPLAAGIGLYLSMADGEDGAEVYSAATTRDQARIVLNYAANMSLRSPRLKKFVECYKVKEDYATIAIRKTSSRFQALSADADTLDGLSTSAAIIDEVHAHKTRRVWDVIKTSTSARRQPMMLGITTAGFDRKTLCYELYQRGTQILEGAYEDDSFFAYIAEIDKDDDWKDEAAWPKANPNLGVSKKWDYMRDEFAAAKNSPAYQNTFRRLDLNQWTEQSSRAIDMDEWHACAGRVDPEDLRGKSCFGGLDLASVQDLTALVLDFPVEENGKKIHKLLSYFWLPEEAIAKRSQRDNIHYDVWAEKGLIRLTPGNRTDYDFVLRDIVELSRQFQIREIAFDKMLANYVAPKLSEANVKMVEHQQGFISMNMPTKNFIAAITNREIVHGAHPVLTWNASNLATSEDAHANWKPDKQKSTEKIDGMVAAIMAHGRATIAPESTFAHSDGILFL